MRGSQTAGVALGQAAGVALGVTAVDADKTRAAEERFPSTAGARPPGGRHA
ncbi:hypothetical protein [Streptomyces sp. G45]|uniref:hypothetical protein n=1 Tax=Streptomyces sp. G45 TaxID=3406627 RepID=UPI003C13E274